MNPSPCLNAHLFHSAFQKHRLCHVIIMVSPIKVDSVQLFVRAMSRRMSERRSIIDHLHVLFWMLICPLGLLTNLTSKTCKAKRFHTNFHDPITSHLIKSSPGMVLFLVGYQGSPGNILVYRSEMGWETRNLSNS